MSEIILEIKNLQLKAKNAEKTILHDINLTLEEGDFLILLGSNGSGKSSLLKLITGRYPITFGEMKLGVTNKEIITLTQDSMESLFGNLTVLENCLLYEERQSKKFFRFATRQKRIFFSKYLESFNKKLPSKLNTKVATLSGGEKQALVLALSFVNKPKLLLLDEYTSALDPKSSLKLTKLTDNLVQEHKVTCVLATHDLDIALNYGNKILALHNGEICRFLKKDAIIHLSRKELLEIY
jgi:putative tryptophan/tyrosine transport system ATP-binding protein